MKRARFVCLFSVAFVILLAGAAVDAAEPMLRSEGSVAPPTDKPADAAASGDTAVKVSGVQVFIDPKTGLMRNPTPEEAAALSAEMQRQLGARTKAMTEPRQVTLANGTVMMELDPNLYSVSVARVLPDGTVTFDCGDGHDQHVEGAGHLHVGAAEE